MAPSTGTTACSTVTSKLVCLRHSAAPKGNSSRWVPSAAISGVAMLAAITTSRAAAPIATCFGVRRAGIKVAGLMVAKTDFNTWESWAPRAIPSMCVTKRPSISGTRRSAKRAKAALPRSRRKGRPSRTHTTKPAAPATANSKPRRTRPGKRHTQSAATDKTAAVTTIATTRATPSIISTRISRARTAARKTSGSMPPLSTGHRPSQSPTGINLGS